MRILNTKQPILIISFLAIITSTLNLIVETNSQQAKAKNTNNSNKEESYRFVYTILNTGNTSPASIINNKDVFNEIWYEAPQELTAVGARKQFFLGHRNKIRYQDFLSDKYLFNEVFLTTQNSTTASQSLYSYLQGHFPHGTGPSIEDNQSEKALPKTPITDLEGIKKKLGNDALLNNNNVFRIFTHQDSDRIIGFTKYTEDSLYTLSKESLTDKSDQSSLSSSNISDSYDSQKNDDKDKSFSIPDSFKIINSPTSALCQGIDNYIDSKIDKSDFISYYKQLKEEFSDMLIKANIINEKKDLTRLKAIEIVDAYIKNKLEQRELKEIKSALNDKEKDFFELVKLIKEKHNRMLFNEFHVQKKQYNKYISRISSSRLFRVIKKYINNRLDYDLKYKTPRVGEKEYEATHPKMVILSVEEGDFNNLIEYIYYSLDITSTYNIGFSDSVSFEVYYKKEKESGEENNNNMLNSKNDTNTLSLKYLETSEEKDYIKDNFFIRLIYNDDIIYDNTIDDYMNKISQYEISNQDIEDFCVNYELIHTETILIIVSSVMGIICFCLIIYAVCLKIEKDKYFNMLSANRLQYQNVFDGNSNYNNNSNTNNTNNNNNGDVLDQSNTNKETSDRLSNSKLNTNNDINNEVNNEEKDNIDYNRD